MATSIKIPDVSERRLNVSSMDLSASVILAYTAWINLSSQSQRGLFSRLFSLFIETNIDSIIADIEAFRADILKVREDITAEEFTWGAAFLLSQLNKPPYSNDLLMAAIKMAAEGHPAAMDIETFRNSVTTKSPGYIGGYDSIVQSVVDTKGTVKELQKAS